MCPTAAEGKVRVAKTDEEIAACYAVMVQLRPHVAEGDFVRRVRHQETQGYALAYVEREGHPVAVAGFRIGDNLPWGKYLYVDDLVTDASTRSTGAGRQLLDWCRQHAESLGCDSLHLDSGVQRFDAHRFYLRERMNITSHHFTLLLPKSIEP